MYRLRRVLRWDYVPCCRFPRGALALVGAGFSFRLGVCPWVGFVLKLVGVAGW